MRDFPWWAKGLIFLPLAALGTVLYFSASDSFNHLWVIAFDTKITLLVEFVLSFLAALTGAFFSVFLYEMTGGGKPWRMATLFAAIPIGLQLYYLLEGRLSMATLSIHVLEFFLIWLAYSLVSLGGRRIWRRFFRDAAAVPE